jgi:sugar phosphate isomerase/epimerase
MYTVLNVTDDRTHCGHIGHTVDDFGRVCELARENGFDGVNVDFRADAHLDLDTRRALLGDLRAVAFGLPVDIYSEHTEREFRRGVVEFERQAEQAYGLGCHVVLAYLPPFSSELRFDEYFRLFARRLSVLRPILAEYDLKLGLEFIGPVETRAVSKYDFVHTIDGVRSLIAAADLHGLAGFKLDVHHWQNSGAGLLDLHHLDLDYILYVEINDGLAGHDIFSMPEFVRELPLATGVTRLPEFLSVLDQKGYDGAVAVEPWNEAIQRMDVDEAVRTVKQALDRALSPIRPTVTVPMTPGEEGDQRR